MRFWLYAAMLFCLLTVIFVVLPSPDWHTRLAGGTLPPQHSPARCFALDYSPPDTLGWRPTAIRLGTDSLYPGWMQERPAYPADGEWSSHPEYFGRWWTAGPDSIDIGMWYHAPIIRLSARGDTLEGRTLHRWRLADESLLGSLVQAMSSPPRQTVRAIPVPCASRDWATWP
ncbi:MAG TPA: hypothetical protein VFK13_07610 [Gemmatimonadaceae bacterium]|nr:hypothetical protein [Gemmatimonadaceae bacterium]